MEKNVFVLTPFCNLAYMIIRRGMFISEFCKHMEMCTSSFRNKMLGRQEWTLAEMERAREVLTYEGSLDKLFSRRKN